MKYFWLTIKHKWFVFLAGLKTGAPLWRLVIHDWHKLRPFSELRHYQRQFFGKADDPLGFSVCWLHHQNHCPHHWEYWIPRSGHSRGGFSDNEPLPMPDWAVREMLADWMGASRAYEGRWPNVANWKWLNENRPKMRLHSLTQQRLDFWLSYMAGTKNPLTGPR